MDRKQKIIRQIVDQGILPQYFHPDPITCIEIAKTLYNAGFRLIKYSNRGEGAVSNFLQLRKFADKELPGLQLGVGNVRNKIEATEFINEGACFIACPGVIEGVANLVNKNDLLWIPGCLTATEIIMADDLGAHLIRLFPGSLLGSAYLKMITELFPNLLFMPAGGIISTDESLLDWFNHGAAAVAMDVNLLGADLVEAKNFAALQSLAKHTFELAGKHK